MVDPAPDGRGTPNLRDGADGQLVARIAAGDARALGTLYDNYGAVMYRLAMAITRDRASAEAVVADAFLTVWRDAAGPGSEGRSPFAWLSSTVRDLALARRTRPAVDPASLQWPDGSPVTAALARLDEPQRRAIELAYFQGLSRREIAAALGEPETDVGRHLRSAMEVLRSVLPAARADEDHPAAPRLAAGR